MSINLWGNKEDYNIERFKNLKVTTEKVDNTFELSINSYLDKFEQLCLHNKISENSEKKLINLFTRKEKEYIKNYAKTHYELLDKMTESYHMKSQDALNYFISNIANTYNKLENKSMIDFNDEKNLKFYSSFRKNINYTNKEYTKTTITEYTKEEKIKNKNRFNIKETKEDYIKYSLEEKLKGEFLFEQDKKYSAKKLSTIFYLQEVVDKKEEEYSAYMITFTNPSSNIYYKQKKNAVIEYQGDFKNFIKNPNYDKDNGTFEESIIKGAELQKEINRHFYLSLKKKIERFESKENRSEVLHFTIFENTKQLHFHSHKLMLIPSKYHNLMKEAFNNTNEYFGLKQVQFDHLENIENSKINEEEKSTGQKLNRAKGSTYVYKYLFKTLNVDVNQFTSDFIKVDRNDYYEESDEWFQENESKLREEKLNSMFQESFNQNIFFNLFRRYFSQFRIFTASRFQHTTQRKIDIMYKYLKEHYPSYLKEMKSKGSLYYQIEQMELKGIFVFEKDTKLSHKFNIEAIEDRLSELIEHHKNIIVESIKREQKELKKCKLKAIEGVKCLKRNNINDKVFLKEYYKGTFLIEAERKNINIKKRLSDNTINNIAKKSAIKKARYDLLQELENETNTSETIIDYLDYKLRKIGSLKNDIDISNFKYITKIKKSFVKECRFSLIEFNNLVLNKDDNSEDEEKELIFHHEMYSLGGFTLSEFFSLH